MKLLRNQKKGGLKIDYLEAIGSLPPLDLNKIYGHGLTMVGCEKAGLMRLDPRRMILELDMSSLNSISSRAMIVLMLEINHIICNYKGMMSLRGRVLALSS